MRPELSLRPLRTRGRPCRWRRPHRPSMVDHAIGTSIRASTARAGTPTPAPARAPAPVRRRHPRADARAAPQQPLPCAHRLPCHRRSDHTISTGVRTIDGPAPPSVAPGPVRAPAQEAADVAPDAAHAPAPVELSLAIPCAYLDRYAVGRPACAGRSRAGETSSAAVTPESIACTRLCAAAPSLSCAALWFR